MTSLHKGIKFIRLDLGLTQGDLARISGLTRQTISSLEKEESAHSPTTNTIKAVARGLNFESIEALYAAISSISNVDPEMAT